MGEAHPHIGLGDATGGVDDLHRPASDSECPGALTQRE
jgi:hypothetical protein